MSEELKPCSWCGADPISKDGFARCYNQEQCKANYRVGWLEHDIWNNSPIEDALRAEIEELDELLRNAHDVLQTAKEAYNVYDYDDVMTKIRERVNAKKTPRR